MNDLNVYEIELKLKSMKRNKKYIALSLYPEIGNNIITKDSNRLFINEGSDGKWDNVSEEFYDNMVSKYDSRS